MIRQSLPKPFQMVKKIGFLTAYKTNKANETKIYLESKMYIYKCNLDKNYSPIHIL